MVFDWSFRRNFGVCLLIGTILSGCGTSSSPVAEIDVNETSVVDNTNPSGHLPLLAVPGPDDSNAAGAKGKITRTAATAKSGPTLLPKGLFGKKATQQDAPPENDPAPQKVVEKGSPEWLLNEIQRTRLLPLPNERMSSRNSDDSKEENEDEDEEDEQPLTPDQEKKLSQEIERTKGIRRERNLKIIKLAEECIQKTNKSPEQEPLFSAAVHNLLDARLQMALSGDGTSIEALYEADKVFFERNPKSDAASESALTLVNLTHANALRYGRKDPRWLKEFSKQTQSYATRFPDEMARSVPLLMASARSCEMNGQIDEARACYTMLGSKFKDTPQGQQATNTLRRLQLKGQELELSGPGIDGSEINVKSYKGKMVLVVFWASNAQPFVQQVSKIAEVTAKYRKYLTVVGVTLDTDEKVVDAFVEANRLEWLQIFSENPKQRGWNSPIAVRYGVNSLPTIWLLDPNGIVAETNLDSSNLEAKIREVYGPFRNKPAAAK